MQTCFTVAPTSDVATTWATVGQLHGVPAPNPHRFATWYWSRVTEHNKEEHVARAQALGAELLFMDAAVRDEDWTFDTAKFPSGINTTAAYIRSQGHLVGLHTLPYPPTHLVDDPAFVRDVLVPEGLAPTYRSGNTWVAHGRPAGTVPSEDVGFWWGHEKAGSTAANGNPTHNWYDS